MFGDYEDEAELIMLGFADARALIAMLTGAVNAPLPRPVRDGVR